MGGCRDEAGRNTRVMEDLLPYLPTQATILLRVTTRYLLTLARTGHGAKSEAHAEKSGASESGGRFCSNHASLVRT